MVSQDEENGLKHLFQAIIQFMINQCPEQQKLAIPLCKKLYDNSIFDDEFFIKWHAKKLKLDRGSALYDRAAETAMRGLITDFVNWLSSAEYDEETGYGEEEEVEEEKKADEPEETEAEKNQRLLIEAQKKAQAELLLAAKVQGAEKAEQAEQAAVQEAETAAAELEAVKATTNVSKIAVEENFDIDDI